ncbi:FAD-dependent monooxygenase [Streptomyces sp. NPDC057654]|uniref:FAD-dependent monooxygenase n=1 Tax=Streptomyces sp. NPDC057654 TaxID=3346196 RepID=UPI003695267B
MPEATSGSISEAAAGTVLIAGAGPAGLVLALELSRRGVPHRLVEAADAPFPGSKGKGLQPRTQEVFDDLGVIEAIHAKGSPYPPMTTWENGEPGPDWEMMTRGEPTPNTPYAEPWLLPQSRTQEVLRDRLRELGGRVEFGVRLKEFEQDEGGVTAELTGPSGTSERVRASYLVAADGGRSTVRAALGTPFTGETVDPTPMLTADMEMEGLPRTHWHTWNSHPGGVVAMCPLPHSNLFQTYVRFEAGDPDPAPEAVRRLVAERTGLQPGKVHWASAFRTRAAMAERFREGRVFLTGDAAHIHSPAGGQGLNTSIQDAYNLGWKLAAVIQRDAPDALLDSYEAERLPVAAGVLGLSTRIHRGGTTGPLSGHRGPDNHQLGLGYRESPLSVERREGLEERALRAGDRAPDAPCKDARTGETRRLFDVFRGTHFTLLGVGDVELPVVGGALATSVKAYRVGGPTPDLLDPEGYAARAYGERGFFLIRPDGYVGVASGDLADVLGYWGVGG